MAKVEICFDTETTGTSRADDRICEIGCVEIVDYIPTGRTFHAYIDPKRAMPREAEAVHGLSDDFLKGKPVFRQVLPAFLDFIGDRPLVAHNASFDIGMINAELGRMGRDPIGNPVVDTLPIARKRRPGQKNNLDALSKAYGVNASKRVKHGALIDAEILAGIYLQLMGGPQRGLALDETQQNSTNTELQAEPIRFRNRPRITAEELARHRAFVEGLGPKAIWLECEIDARYFRRGESR